MKNMSSKDWLRWAPIAVGALAILIGLVVPGGVWVSLLSNLAPDGELGARATQGISLLGYGIAAGGAVLIALVLLWKYIRQGIEFILTVPRTQFIIGLIAVALVLRVIKMVAIPAIPFTDFWVYNELSINVIEGDGYYNDFSAPGSGDYQTWAYRAPGWPFLIMAAYFITGPNLIVAQSLTLILSVGAVFATYLLARELIDERGGRIAGVLVAFLPSYIMYTGILASEYLFTVLLTFVIWFFVKDQEYWTIPRLVLIGLMLAWATLTRSVAQLWPVVLAVYLIMRFWKPLPVLRVLAVVVPVLILGVLPWGLRNQAVLGEFVSVATNGGHTFVDGTVDCNGTACDTRLSKGIPGVDEITQSDIAYDRGITNIRLDPVGFVTYSATEKMLQFFVFDYETTTLAFLSLPDDFEYNTLIRTGFEGIAQIYWLAFMVPAAISLLNPRLYFQKPQYLLLLGTIAYATAVAFVFHGESRYHFWLVPMFATYASLTISRLLVPLKAEEPDDPLAEADQLLSPAK